MSYVLNQVNKTFSTYKSIKIVENVLCAQPRHFNTDTRPSTTQPSASHPKSKLIKILILILKILKF